jgi:hypothetical protein
MYANGNKLPGKGAAGRYLEPSCANSTAASKHAMQPEEEEA